VVLGPAVNIKRSPLCGRNFEYYAEDPLLSGKMAAAVTRGVQGVGGVGVSIKHFCCNNQEDNRTHVSANVSERALREIYLRGFEIAVREGKPWTVMSSYNRVNGEYVCNSRRLLTDILRKEWGFTGLVMSDWGATDPCSHAEGVNAGNDLIMPGSKAVAKKLESDLKAGKLDRAALHRSAGRVLELVFRSETCRDF
jgi:beta-glucosidase